MAELVTQLKPGEQVGDTQWTVVRRLGSGSYGVVYECEHRTLHHRAAVKILKPKSGELARLGQDKALKAAQMFVTLRHPNLPVVYDANVIAGDLPRMWTAMELLEGHELSAVLDSEKKLKPERALRIALGVARGMDELDTRGVIHRDLKPGNIFLATGDVPKVLDFDMARLMGAGTVSGIGKAVGSPYYMAPEAFGDHRKIDKRVDIWSLGIVLYQCLSGEVPFGGKTLQALVGAIATTRPRSLATDVGKDVWAIVQRALNRDRELRFSSMSQFAEAIEGVLAQRGWNDFAATTVMQVSRSVEAETLDEQDTMSQHVRVSEAGLQSPATTSNEAPSSADVTSHPRMHGRHEPHDETAPTLALNTERPSKLPLLVACLALVVAGVGAWFALSLRVPTPTQAGVVGDVAPHSQALTSASPPSTSGAPVTPNVAVLPASSATSASATVTATALPDPPRVHVPVRIPRQKNNKPTPNTKKDDWF